MTDNPFTKSERLIIQTAYQSRRSMSIREIAEKSDLSWVTARKYIRDLLDKKWLTEDKRAVRLKVKFNYNKLKEVKK